MPDSNGLELDGSALREFQGPLASCQRSWRFAHSNGSAQRPSLGRFRRTDWGIEVGRRKSLVRVSSQRVHPSNGFGDRFLERDLVIPGRRGNQVRDRCWL